ncbi:hypothetical protein GALL_517770 [mine drainage metagenome]|uniref:Uncharacterized protein n=1 Tax=mine drainage metagenome TaxID=410659 RepID=A0A1J5PMY4_9ZZZZ
MHFFQDLGGRQTAVTGKGENHARGRSHGSESAQQLRQQDGQQQNHFERAGQYRIERYKKHIAASGGCLVHVGNGNHKRTQHQVAEQRRVNHRTDNAFGHRVRGIVRFFGSVGRCIKTGDGINGQQQSQAKQHPHALGGWPDIAARRSTVVLESHQARQVPVGCVGQQGQCESHGRGENQVAADVRQKRGEFDAQVIDDGLCHGNSNHEAGLRRKIGLPTQSRSEGSNKEVKRAHIDGSEHGDQAQQIQPGGQPAPTASTQNRTPVVKPASRGVG